MFRSNSHFLRLPILLKASQRAGGGRIHLARRAHIARSHWNTWRMQLEEVVKVNPSIMNFIVENPFLWHRACFEASVLQRVAQR